MVRNLSNPKGEPRTQHARTPHQSLNGTITPNPLHFTILHSGIPDIDPEQHRLVIHGMVKQPLEFTVDALLRYPMITRKYFVECGGNSAALFSNEPVQATGRPVAWAGLLRRVDRRAAFGAARRGRRDPAAKWMLAEGADSLKVSRSIPMKKAYDDAMIALYQNGERLMPGNGYPMRLLLPGYEGNMNTKFVRRIKVDRSAGDDVLRDPQLLAGAAERQGVPVLLRQRGEVVHHPAVVRPTAQGAGLLRNFRHRLFGLGHHHQGQCLGRRRQELGRSGAGRPGDAEAFTRFAMPWRWDGQPVVLTSRAYDDSGAVQPLRADFVAQRGETKQPVKSALAFPNNHYNSLTSWGIDSKGEIKNVYV